MLCCVQDLYQKWLDGDDGVIRIAEDQDPFWEPTEDVLIGTGNIFLQSLAYSLDFDDDITIADYKVDDVFKTIYFNFPTFRGIEYLDKVIVFTLIAGDGRRESARAGGSVFRRKASQ